MIQYLTTTMLGRLARYEAAEDKEEFKRSIGQEVEKLVTVPFGVPLLHNIG